jgi:manganese efflux pump family protein
MLALLLVAASVGLSNLVASIGIGASGADLATRIRVAAIFGVLEAGMPIAGLLIGHDLAGAIGRQARWLAAALLVAVGGYAIWTAARRRPAQAGDGGRAGTGSPAQGTVRLLVTGLALSMDNLVVGFALGTYRVSLVAGAIVFGVVSTALSLAGLEIGSRLGRRVGERGELLGGCVLVGVGLAIGFGALG